MFGIVTVVHVHALYCDSGTQEKSLKSTILSTWAAKLQHLIGN
jgi:hypothetical protein